MEPKPLSTLSPFKLQMVTRESQRSACLSWRLRVEGGLCSHLLMSLPPNVPSQVLSSFILERAVTINKLRPPHKQVIRWISGVL